jgi:hypothetical protein
MRKFVNVLRLSDFDGNFDVVGWHWLMLTLLVVFGASDTGITPADMAVGIMSGKEVLMSRFLAQAQTWIPTFPEVFVYSDKFPNTTKEEILASSPRAKIQFVELPNLAEHIIGSQWQRPWYQAQPRFLPGMYHLWKNNPKALWYVVGDDDTYLIVRNIIRRLTKVSSSNHAALSFFWCTWDQIAEFMLPRRDCHPFAQGGSGVLFSHTLMESLGPHLIECNDKYNDAEHAASMRVAVCAERLFGYENWTKSAYIKHWRSGIHPTSPGVTITLGNTWDPPGSFHQVQPDEMHVLKRSHISDVGDGHYYDFGGYAFRSLPIEFTYRRIWQLHFGYRIDNIGTHTQKLYSKTDIHTSDGGHTFVQEFDGNISIVVHCDRTHGEDVIRVDEVNRGPNVTVHLSLICPRKQRYYH